MAVTPASHHLVLSLTGSGRDVPDALLLAVGRRLGIFGVVLGVLFMATAFRPSDAGSDSRQQCTGRTRSQAPRRSRLLGRAAASGRPLPRRDSTCYIRVMTENLADVARRTDEATSRARSELVGAVRRAAAAGMTQAQIAQQIGRSQPEVSRLLRFHGTSPLARRLRASASQVRQIVAEAGGSRVRVFGSVATGRDNPHSDIDLVFTMGKPLSLMELGRLEQRLGDAIGARVDLVPDSAIRPDIRERVLAEAVAL